MSASSFPSWSIVSTFKRGITTEASSFRMTLGGLPQRWQRPSSALH